MVIISILKDLIFILLILELNIIIIQQRMSFIIDNAKSKYFLNFDKIKRERKSSQSASKQIKRWQQTELCAKSLQISLNQQKISYKRDFISHNKTKLTLEELISLQDLYGLMSLTFYKVSNSISINISLLNCQQQYLKIGRQEDRLSLNKKLLVSKKGIGNFNIKSSINIKTGHINFSMPLYNLFQKRQRNVQFLRPKFIRINQIYNSIANQFKKYISFIDIFDQNRLSNKQAFRYIVKSFQMIHVNRKQKFLGKSQNYDSKEEKTLQNQAIKALITNKVNTPTHFKSSLALFSKCQLIYDQIKDKNDCLFQKKKEESFQKEITIRKNPERFFKSGHHIDDCKLISSILVKDPLNVTLRNINNGGFASILEGQMIFWMTKDEETNASLKNIVQKTPPMKAIIVVKKEQLKSGKLLGKNKHQKKIISLLKNSQSSYLNRYFNPINKDGSFSNDILMQKISPLNLNQYICLRKESMSLHFKLIILFNIIQGLRSLCQYKVVHMDLKPANIIISNIYDLKIIDFGESYHSKVCQKSSYKPGYTVPYSCPEIKTNAKKFTQKSDIFSFGVIMNEILHKKSPFYFYDNKNLIKLAKKQYLNHWFYSQQQNEYEPIINKFLNQLISKCLDSDAQRRPDLTMIAIFLHQCIQIIS